MINIPYKKIYNAYIIETYNYESAKNSIKEFAIANGFDKNLVKTENHPDILYIESSDSNIPIDVVRRDIVNTAIYSPKISDKKIYVIYDSVNLEEPAQNTMLKTLEEPPNFDIFFLVTSNANKFLETIRSRCITIKDNEDIDLKNLLNLEYLDDAIFILTNAKTLTASEKMSFAEKFYGDGYSLKDLIKLYRYLIRDTLMYIKTLSKENINLRECEESVITLSYTYDMKELGLLVEKLNQLSDINRNNVNKKIALYNFLEV